ncbi:Centlein [Stylophora pistillata]|uniref:Centlein n=1 Tax=Stylophora pistillata TaxID=50429 RepID=A0A2B4RH47_STYPI|nr:Centlein [Stylophora pistillata]
MERADQQKALEDLIEENRAILEELAQCKADKDFVWNLWRRLQSSQPDVTSVVSMVIAREQEKSEQKDKKVLEILQMKDEKIKELKGNLLSLEDEAHYSKTRYHDLLIENEELKQKLDEVQKEFSTKQREMSEENSYLSTLLKAHQAQKEVDDQTVKDNLDGIEEEKNQLKIRIAVLEKQVSDLSEEKLKMASVIEVNATLEEKMKTLADEVSTLTLKNTEVAKNCEEAEIELTNRENLLQKQSQSLQEQAQMIRKLESDLEAVNRDFEQVRVESNQSMAQMSEKERIIQQLEENEQRNRQALMDHEQEYRRGIASLQKSVADLQARCSAYQEKETKLLQDIEKLKENSCKQREDLNVKELIIDELKDAVREGMRSGEVSRRDDEEEGKGRPMERKARTQAKIGEGKSRRRGEDIELESLEERNRTEVTNRSDDETADESPSKMVMNEESLERKIDKVTVLRDLETRLSEKQIKTYEASNADETGNVKPPPEKSEERELRHLDSDQVWKELAYYRHEYEELAKERHAVLEEIDVLRVQHSHNVANIQELQVHLREEREESNTLRSKIAAETQAFETLRLKAEKVEDQLQSWQEKALRGQTMCNELEEENQLLRHEIKAIQGQNKSLAEEFSGLAEEFENLKKRHDELVNKEAKKTENDREVSGAAQDGTAQLENTTESAQEDAEFAKQHVESLSSYDEQVKRIADRILSSPPKDSGESERKFSSSHGTQTDPIPRFVDTSVHVNLDAEDASSMDEEDTNNVKSSAEKKSAVSKETGVRRQGTPQPKIVARKTPRRNEGASMRQRILSLTQEVNALRQSKDKAVKALSVQTSDYESLQKE